MDAMTRWLPVKRYSGGSEHTTMHLLYARFFHKALHDLSLVPGTEPFAERFNRGLILGPDGQKMSKRCEPGRDAPEVRRGRGAHVPRVRRAL